MSGHESVVQARLPVHCATHLHSLVIVKSCSVPEYRNCIDNIKSITIWVKYSHREHMHQVE